MSPQNIKIETTVKERIGQIIDLLVRTYDAPEWRPSYDPVSVLVGTILSQNTSDVNSGNAFRSLKACFSVWEDIADAGTDAIAHCIRQGGLANIKAHRIKQTLQEIGRKRGQIELGFLSQLPLVDAQNWLCQLHGVGLKTARCVLLFALGLPALPVDTHIWRVAKRLGLVPLKTSLDEAHRALEEMVPPEDVYKFHVLVIEHGRSTCHARWPNCQDCILKDICPSYPGYARDDHKTSGKTI